MLQLAMDYGDVTQRLIGRRRSELCSHGEWRTCRKLVLDNALWTLYIDGSRIERPHSRSPLAKRQKDE